MIKITANVIVISLLRMFRPSSGAIFNNANYILVLIEIETDFNQYQDVICVSFLLSVENGTRRGPKHSQ